MDIKIALAGNPNCGKTTMFNDLTGSNQFVGNWPGVTVEKKEGKLKGTGDVIIQDLPGIYSLSPYTQEEVITRNYLVNEKPDSIINIVDGTNIERNLYLSTQLLELGIPTVMAINMMDVVNRNGDFIDTKKLGKILGCHVIEASALKGFGSKEAAQKAAELARENMPAEAFHVFMGSVEHAIAHIEEEIEDKVEKRFLRWYAVKLFERDAKACAGLNLDSATLSHIEQHIKDCEIELDDDAESIIINQRYAYIKKVMETCVKKANTGAKMSVSDKIDRIVTNRWLALPIFAVVMFLVYYVSITTVGAWATDWVNDNLFGDGYHLFGIGSSAYSEAADEYSANALIVEGFDAFTEEYGAEPAGDFEYAVTDEETLEVSYETASLEEYSAAAAYLAANEEPDPADYGVWIPGIPALIESGLDAVDCAGWLKGLILDGIVAGVGAVLGFVPQMLVLFIFLAFLEACGYMARIAFIMDRIFRRFGLSGKSFIPMLVGTGCGVPGIMASRTIENESDRRMTVMTTTFIPCGAKLPFIALCTGAFFGGNPWIAPGAYFIGVAAIIVSGIMLKKTRMFAGEAAPFVMELPAYHLPTVGNVLRSMWERGWSFIKKAGTIILLSTIVVWFTSFFGWADGAFTMLEEEQMDCSILAKIGSAIAWIFSPLGWGNWQATVAAVTGLVAKENIVGTLGILYGDWAGMGEAFSSLAGFTFLVFNLLCAPCFAAMGAIKREMNSRKWFWFAIGYQCGFAWLVGFVIYQLGSLFSGAVLGAGGMAGVIGAFAVLCGFVYMLLRKNKYSKAN